MKKCPSCHQPVVAGSSFCEHCGFDLRTATTETTGKPHRLGRHGKTAIAKPAKKSKWLSRGLWCLLAVAVITVGVLGISFYNKQAGKEKQIATITDNITDNQSNDFAEKLVSDNPNLKITGNTVQPFMTYARTHPNYVKAMKSDLQRSGKTRDSLFTLETDGHNFLIFPIYKLRVATMHPVLSTNIANVTLMANGKALVTSKNNHYTYQAGPLFPGHYTFRLAGSQSKASVTTNLIASNDRNKQIDLNAKTASRGHDVTNNNEDETTVTDATGGQTPTTPTGKSIDAMSDTTQTAVNELVYNDDIDDAYDYTYTESTPQPDVTEIKLYDKDTDKLDSTYRYDDIHDILAKYETSSGKFKTISITDGDDPD